MAVPSSGPLGLRSNLGLEVFGNETGSDISLHALALDAGFSTPDEMSEFYGYTSEVTVSLNGGQSRTGSPGSSGFGSMYFDVSAPSGRGFTNTDAGNASINSGLPSAFTYNFSRTGTSTGRYYITTPDGNYPNDSYALQSSNFTVSTPSTPLYTLTVSFSGTFTGTGSSTVFQGSNAGVGRNRTSSFATLYNNNATGSGSGVSVSGYGSSQVNQGVGASRSMNGNFSTNVSTNASSSDQWARVPSGGINSPPWGNGGSQNAQAFVTCYYPSQSLVDSRVSACCQFNFSTGVQQNYGLWIRPDATNSFYQHFTPGSGTYTVSVKSNHPLGSTIGSASSPWFGSDIRIKTDITYL